MLLNCHIKGGEQLDISQDGHAWRSGHAHSEKSSVELHPLPLRDTVSKTHTQQIFLPGNKGLESFQWWGQTLLLMCKQKHTLNSSEMGLTFVFYTRRYDDYDYGSVNVLLERSLKLFVKTMACHPEQTTARIYHSFWRHFRHSEKVGVSSNTPLPLPLHSQCTNHLTF